MDSYFKGLILIGTLLLLLSACGEGQPEVEILINPNSPLPPAATSTFYSPASEAEAATYTPLPAETCTTLQAALAAPLETGITQSTAPFQDYITGGTGSACRLEATGTGQDFPHFVEVAAKLRAMLEELGWTEQPAYLADGPTGTATAFQQGVNLCLVRVDWEPAAGVECPADQPISACEVPPEQQLYTILLECAQRRPGME